MILVTGGTGLVGSHILLNLSKEKKSFRALKREKSSLHITKKIFDHYNASKLFEDIEWIKGDILDIPSLEESLELCDQVIHAAAMVSFHSEDVKEMYKINVEGTANVMNVSLSSNIQKVCYISSIAALGRNNTNKIIDEECYFTPSNKENNYSTSKYYAEQEVWRAAQEGLNVVILNPSVILGPGDWNKGSSQIFQRSNQGLKYYTTGSTGYVDVIDVANCATILLESNIKNNRFIINSENLKYREVFDMLAENFGQPKATFKVTPILKEIAWRLEYLRSLITGKRSILTKETAQTAMRRSKYSTNKIQKEIGYDFISIKKSLKKYCHWYMSEINI